MSNEGNYTPAKGNHLTKLSNQSKRYQSPLGTKRTWDVKTRVGSPFRRLPEPSPFRSFKNEVVSPIYNADVASSIKMSPLTSTDVENTAPQKDGEDGGDIMDWIKAIKEKALNILQTEREEEKKFYDEVEYQKKLIEAHQEINTDSFDKLKIFLDEERAQQQKEVDEEEESMSERYREQEEQEEGLDYESNFSDTGKTEEVEILDSEPEAQEEEYDSEGNIIIPLNAHIQEVSSDEDDDQEPVYHQYDSSNFRDDETQYRVTPQYGSIYRSQNPFGREEDLQNPQEDESNLGQYQNQVEGVEQEYSDDLGLDVEEIDEDEEISDHSPEPYEEDHEEQYSGYSDDQEAEKYSGSGYSSQEVHEEYEHPQSHSDYDTETQNIMDNDVTNFEILASAALLNASPEDHGRVPLPDESEEKQHKHKEFDSDNDQCSYEEERKEGAVSEHNDFYHPEAEDIDGYENTNESLEDDHVGNNAETEDILTHQQQEHYSEVFDQELIDEELLLNRRDSVIPEEGEMEDGEEKEGVAAPIIEEVAQETKADVEFSEAVVEEPKSVEPGAKDEELEVFGQNGYIDEEIEEPENVKEENTPEGEPVYEEVQYYDSDGDVPFQDPSVSLFGDVTKRDLLDTLDAASDKEEINTNSVLASLNDEDNEDKMVVDNYLDTEIPQPMHIAETVPEAREDLEEHQQESEQDLDQRSEYGEGQTTFVSFFSEGYHRPSSAPHSFADVSSDFVKSITPHIEQPKDTPALSSPRKIQSDISNFIARESSAIPDAVTDVLNNGLDIPVSEKREEVQSSSNVLDQTDDSDLGDNSKHNIKDHENVPQKASEDEETSKNKGYISPKDTQSSTFREASHNFVDDLAKGAQNIQSEFEKASNGFLVTSLGEDPESFVDDVSKGAERIESKLEEAADDALESGLGENPESLVNDVSNGAGHIESELEKVANDALQNALGEDPKSLIDNVSKGATKIAKVLPETLTHVADEMLENSQGKEYEKNVQNETEAVADAINSTTGNPFVTALEESLGETAEEFVENLAKGTDLLEEQIEEKLEEMQEEYGEPEHREQTPTPSATSRNPLSLLSRIWEKALIDPFENTSVNTTADLTTTDLLSSTPLKSFSRTTNKADEINNGTTDYQDFSMTQSILKDDELEPAEQLLKDGHQEFYKVATEDILEQEKSIEEKGESTTEAAEVINNDKKNHIFLGNIVENASEVLEYELGAPVEPTQGEVDVDKVVEDVAEAIAETADVIIQAGEDYVEENVVKPVERVVEEKIVAPVEDFVEKSKEILQEELDNTVTDPTEANEPPADVEKNVSVIEMAKSASEALEHELDAPVEPTQGEVDVDKVVEDVAEAIAETADVIIQAGEDYVEEHVVKPVERVVEEKILTPVEDFVEKSKVILEEELDNAVTEPTESADEPADRKHNHAHLPEFVGDASEALKYELAAPVEPTEGEVDVDEVVEDVAEAIFETADVIAQAGENKIEEHVVKPIEDFVEKSKEILQEQLDNAITETRGEIDVDQAIESAIGYASKSTKDFVEEHANVSLGDIPDAADKFVFDAIENPAVEAKNTPELLSALNELPKNSRSPLKALKDWWSGSKRKRGSQEVESDPAEVLADNVAEIEGDLQGDKDSAPSAASPNLPEHTELPPKKRTQHYPVADYQPGHLVMKTRSGKIIGAHTEEEVEKAEEILDQEEKLIEKIVHGEVDSVKRLKVLATSYEDFEGHPTHAEPLGTDHTNDKINEEANTVAEGTQQVEPPEAHHQIQENSKESSDTFKKDVSESVDTLKIPKRGRGRPAKRSKTENIVSSGRVTKEKKNVRGKQKRKARNTVDKDEDEDVKTGDFPVRSARNSRKKDRNDGDDDDVKPEDQPHTRRTLRSHTK